VQLPHRLHKQVISLGRIKCAICGDRISGWAWTAPDGDGHAVVATWLIGADGSAGPSRAAIGAGYEGSSGSLPNLSSLSADEGDPSRAADSAAKAAIIFEQAFGPEHPDTISALALQGSQLKDLGACRPALELLQQAGARAL